VPLGASGLLPSRNDKVEDYSTIIPFSVAPTQTNKRTYEHSMDGLRPVRDRTLLVCLLGFHHDGQGRRTIVDETVETKVLLPIFI